MLCLACSLARSSLVVVVSGCSWGYSGAMREVQRGEEIPAATTRPYALPPLFLAVPCRPDVMKTRAVSEGHVHKFHPHRSHGARRIIFEVAKSSGVRGCLNETFAFEASNVNVQSVP